MAKKSIFNLFSNKISYKRKLLFITTGLVIGLSSLLFTSSVVQKLSLKEKSEVQLWSHAMSMIGSSNEALSHREMNHFHRLLSEIIATNNTIPSIVTDRNYNVIDYTNIDEKTINSPEKLRKMLEEMAAMNNIIELTLFNTDSIYIFYSESTLLKQLRYFPYIQLSVIFIFIIFAFVIFTTSKHDEQNRVWIGMAKETAHQLGTPTSSLLGWIEYLRNQDVEDFVVDEMSKDITRLLKVVDRFSKIGSKTILAPKNIFEIVENAVVYFKTRIPKNVQLIYNTSTSLPLQASINEALFEWVIENLLKNALDALSGTGSITVTVKDDSKWIYISVEDTGKGISKSNQQKVFNPGFTTKTRGWGLGLSLSRRIVEDYHAGHIYVANSELGKGTTMQIQVKKL
ncbi:MAG: ATP-binding protein [Rikenellaceae bacterium]